MLRVQTVKLVGPGLDSMSPERRIKAKIRGLRQYWIREREKIRLDAPYSVLSASTLQICR